MFRTSTAKTSQSCQLFTLASLASSLAFRSLCDMFEAPLHDFYGRLLGVPCSSELAAKDVVGSQAFDCALLSPLIAKNANPSREMLPTEHPALPLFESFRIRPKPKEFTTLPNESPHIVRGRQVQSVSNTLVCEDRVLVVAGENPNRGEDIELFDDHIPSVPLAPPKKN